MCVYMCKLVPSHQAWKTLLQLIIIKYSNATVPAKANTLAQISCACADANDLTTPKTSFEHHAKISCKCLASSFLSRPPAQLWNRAVKTALTLSVQVPATACLQWALPTKAWVNQSQPIKCCITTTHEIRTLGLTVETVLKTCLHKCWALNKVQHVDFYIKPFYFNTCTVAHKGWRDMWISSCIFAKPVHKALIMGSGFSEP